MLFYLQKRNLQASSKTIFQGQKGQKQFGGAFTFAQKTVLGRPLIVKGPGI
jgi:hypothetical protein